MRNKIIYTFIVIFLISFAHGTLNDGVIGYWSFDDSSIVGGTYNSSVYSKYALNNGGTGGGSGYTNEMIDLDGTNDYLNATYDIPGITGNVSIFCWVNMDTNQLGDGLVHKDNNYINGAYRDFLWSVSLTDSSQYVLYVWNTGATLDSVSSNASVTTNQWDYIGFTYTSSTGEMELFKNGYGVGRKTHSGGGDLRNTYPKLNFGRTQDDAESGRYFDGSMDECIMYNRGLDNTEALDLYTEVSTGSQYPFSTGDPQPSLTLDTLYNNSQNLTVETLVLTVDGVATGATVDVWNCSFYLNETFLQTYGNLTLNDTSQDWYGLHEVVTIGWDGITVNYTVNCSNGETNDSLTVTNLFIDSVQPDETVIGIANGNKYYKNLTATQIWYNLTVFDTNLFAVNQTIKYPNGTPIFNQFNTSLNISTYNFNYSRNYNDYPTGYNYSLHIQAWDSHTSLVLKYDISKLDDYTYNYNGVIITSDKKIKPTKEKDKYIFDVEKKAWFCYHSTNGFEKIQDSEYPNHYIDFEQEVWVDEWEYNFIETIEAGKITQLCFYNDKETKYTTSSIGDLNTIDTTYYFDILESFYIYAIDQQTNISLSDFTILAFNDTYQDEKNTTIGVIVFNLTSGNYSFNFSSTGFIDLTEENFNTSAGGNFTFNVNATNAFRVYIKDQLTLDYIADRTIYLEFIDANFNSSNNYTTSTGIKYITDLSPSDYIIRYSAVNYTTDFYYFTLVNGTNVEFTIYMLSNLTSDEITATVVDEINQPVANAYIHVQRYDVNTNTYPTVSIVKTNFEGVAKLQVTKNTEFYKFLIYYENVLKKSITPTYIYEDNINFQIKLTDDIAQNFFVTEDIIHSLDYNTATENFRFIFSDATNTITSGTLRVYNITTTTQNLVGETTTTATSGTILINAPNISGTTYRADTFVTISGEEIFLGSGYYTYPASAPLTQEKNYTFYVVLLSILFATMLYWDIRIAVLVVPLPWFFASLLNFIPIGAHITGILELMAVIVVAVMTYSGYTR
jgi:hypothetical protein